MNAIKDVEFFFHCEHPKNIKTKKVQKVFIYVLYLKKNFFKTCNSYCIIFLHQITNGTNVVLPANHQYIKKF